MNVRVDLNYPIYDGAEIVFKAPCDASKVTGLIVYYPGDTGVVSSVFTFADAHTNDLGTIDELFAKGAVVKVILDTDTNMAFVQNAVTNAYLENRFANMGSGVNTIIVTINGSFASHNASQIRDHVENGGYALLYAGNTFYMLDSCDETTAVFEALPDVSLSYIRTELYTINNLGRPAMAGTYIPIVSCLEEQGLTDGQKAQARRNIGAAAVGEGGTVEVDTSLSDPGKAADAKAVGDAIGDVSSALTELHNYAETLKGGDAV